MRTERLLETVLNSVKEKIEDFRNGGSRIVLERVPDDLRHSIWKSDAESLRDTINGVSDKLVSLGQKPLNGSEYRDAFEGWDVMNRARGIS